MQIQLRLYAPYDNDLISLRIIAGRKFAKLVRNAVRACIYNTGYVIHVPKNIYKYAYEPTNTVVVNLYFNEKKDQQLIYVLHNIKKGSITSILKIMIRYCFDCFPIGTFLPAQIRDQFPLVTLKGTEQSVSDMPEIDQSNISGSEEQRPKNPSKKENDKIVNSTYEEPKQKSKKKTTKTIPVELDQREPDNDDVDHNISSDSKESLVTSTDFKDPTPEIPDESDDIFAMLEGMVNH